MILAVLLAVSAFGPVAGAFSGSAGARATVIVRAEPAAVRDAERAVTSVGGRLTRRLPIIDGFTARVPASAVARLRAHPAIASVSADATLSPLSTRDTGPGSGSQSLHDLTSQTGAREMWKRGYTGNGVDIAIIDSGVVQVDGLKGKVLNGPDLSFESQVASRRYLDTYGHGTHLAGIIAGRASAAVSGHYAGDTRNFLGMAPDARLLSLKVADAHGQTDVSQVIAAIGWVVQHKNDNGMNIRVLNLSYGTNSTQHWSLDPLGYAAEQAWKKGIVVVTAAGNAGYAVQGTLTNPASNPWILAIGSSDTNGTATYTDDKVSDFSSSSNWGSSNQRMVDLVAPGRRIASLRVLGSKLDQLYAERAAVSSTLFRGSGTSQSAAVVAGAAALILQQRPTLKPDEVKRLLTFSATRINDDAVKQGFGALNLRTGIGWPDYIVKGYDQAHYLLPSTGLGSLDRARGSHRLTKDGVQLAGERDIFGKTFVSGIIAKLVAAGNSWSGGIWNGSAWSGNSWSGNSWSGNSWSGNSWSGNSWSSLSWSGNSWSGNSWSGNSWSGNSWSSASWTGNSWSSADWE